MYTYYRYVYGYGYGSGPGELGRGGEPPEDCTVSILLPKGLSWSPSSCCLSLPTFRKQTPKNLSSTREMLRDVHLIMLYTFTLPLKKTINNKYHTWPKKHDSLRDPRNVTWNHNVTEIYESVVAASSEMKWSRLFGSLLKVLKQSKSHPKVY